MPAETYLGDAVYAVDQGHHVRLYTHDGIGMTNEIFFDPEVLLAFFSWVKREKPALYDELVRRA